MLLEAHGLHKSFARHRAPAVQNLSLSLRQGEVLGIIGESGCGKSTLARLLTGLLQADAGQIRFEGRAPETLSRQERARSIQLMFQDPAAALHPRKRTGEALKEVLQSVMGLSAIKAQETLLAWLPRLDLEPDLLLRYPHQLSGGQKQRVCFLRALLLEPKILVLDEPLTALDRMTQARVLALFQGLREQIGFSAIFISHDLSMVQRIADRVGVMYAGRWLEAGTTADILQRPQHPYTRFLLQSLPKLYRDPNLVPMPAFKDALEPPPAAGCPLINRCPFAQTPCGAPLPEPTGVTFSACLRPELSGR